MKKHSKLKIYIALAAIMAVFWTPTVWAEGLLCETLIEGTILEIIDGENAIVLSIGEETDAPLTVYGIPLNYFENWGIVSLEAGMDVTINAHDCPFSGRLMACTLIIGVEELDLRPGRRRPSLINTDDAEPGEPSMGNNNRGRTDGPGLRIGVHDDSGPGNGTPPASAPNPGQKANGQGNGSGRGR